MKTLSFCRRPSIQYLVNQGLRYKIYILLVTVRTGFAGVLNYFVCLCFIQAKLAQNVKLFNPFTAGAFPLTNKIVWR